MKKIERKQFPVAELKALDDQGMIEAIVSVTNNVDFGNEIVMPGFFGKSLSRKKPKGVWGHDWHQPIAKTLEAEELSAGDVRLPQNIRELGGYYIKGQFNLETQRGREAFSDIKFGVIDEFSIGYSVNKDERDEETGARKLIEGDWYEWSPVLVGMNPATQLISVKEAEPAPEPDPSETVVTAVQEFAQRMKDFHEIRVKEGRVLSTANRNKVRNCRDAMSELISELDALLEMAEPQPKTLSADEAQDLYGSILATTLSLPLTRSQK